MLSTLVLFRSPAGDEVPALSGLVRTLSSLVPGTIGGLVRDVTIVTGRPDREVRRVADHAGCSIVEHESFERALQIAVAQARSPTLFLLRAGAHVDRAFLEEVAIAVGPEGDGRGPALVLREAPDGLVRRVLPDLSPAAGLIAPASAVDVSAKDFDTLVRRVGGKRTLASRAGMAQ